ncbi:MAG: LiaF transmembrane domain-containing protein [Candidatus Saccharicenans sp.]|uniref:LiaF transmembrane domain-containing protein n=1 Tax=Candidatus Saccharicenans sp. TaxID=2819258 RepID=UPI00404932B6
MSTRSGEGRIFWGLFLVIIGALFLLEQLGYLRFREIIATYWPVILIIIGLSIYIGNGFKRSNQALFLILLGAFFQAIKLHLIERYAWRYLWPVLLIIIGLWLIIKPRIRKT